MRPGRIDRKVEFPQPNLDARLEILKIHSRKMNLMKGIDLRKIAEKMTGCSGAESKVMGFFLVLVCLYGSWYVCVERKEGTCNVRGF